MGFLDLFSHKKGKEYPVEQAVTLLNSLLKKRGFSSEKIDLMLAWSVFQEFCLDYHFRCDGDAILWEVGPYCWLPDGSRTFQWHLVRQFICGSGEDDDIRQLCFNLDFPKGVGEGLQTNLWSYDFNGDFIAFFAAVEAHSAFQASHDAVPAVATIRLDNV